MLFLQIGTIGSVLLKKKMYKEQMEPMIVQYVFPEFQSPHGFLRARACWLLQRLENIKFRQEDNLVQAMNCVQRALLTEDQLPVKFEAAMTLSSFIASQEQAESMLQANMRGIVQVIIIIIKVFSHTLYSILLITLKKKY